MSKELATYKKYRITELQNIFNVNVARLYNTFVTNVRNVQNSFQTLRIKQISVNNLIKQYNTNVGILTAELNNIIQRIQNFIPKQISTNKNKKALLIGINYTGTRDELKGCINDANSMKERISASPNQRMAISSIFSCLIFLLKARSTSARLTSLKRPTSACWAARKT